MRFVGCVAVMLLGAVWTAPAEADCHGVRRAIAVKQATVVQTQTLLVAPVVPFAAGYGSYGVGYNASYSPEYAAVLQKLARIEALLANGQVKPAPQPSPAQPPMPPATDAKAGGQPAVFAAKCVSCHGPAAKPGLAFFDANGQYASDRCELPGLMLSRMLMNEMPPPGKGEVVDEETADVAIWVKSFKPKK